VVTSPSEGQVQPTSQRQDHHEAGQHETRARPRQLVDVALALVASHRVSGRGCEGANDARGGRDQDGPAEHVHKAGELLAALAAVVLHDHLKATNSTPRMAIVKQIQHAQEMMVSTFVLTPGGAVPLPLVPGRPLPPVAPAVPVVTVVPAAHALPASRSVAAVPVAVASAVAGSARRAWARRESPARGVDVIGWLR